MSKIEYTFVQARFNVKKGAAVCVDIEQADLYDEWIPLTCLSSRCELQLDSLRRNELFDLELATWKAKQLGVD